MRSRLCRPRAVDGQENPLVRLHGRQAAHGRPEAPHLVGAMSADPLIFAVSKQVWTTFSPGDQKIITEAALEAGKYGKEIARKGITPEDPSLLKEIEGNGVTITRLSADEQKAFQKATVAVYDKWKAKIGADLVTAAEKSVAAR